MAFTIKLGKISKRTNSTKHTYSLIGEHSVVLKGGSSVIEPTFLLNTPAKFNTLSRCNYVEWVSDDIGTDAVTNYYWIDEITLDLDNIINIKCRRDALATFKYTITGYSGMVARRSTNYDVSIFDPEILVSSKIKKTNKIEKDVKLGPHTQQGNNAFGQSQLSATWQTIGKDGSRVFNIQMLPEQTLAELLNGSGTWEFGVTNPGQYIGDCFVLPFKFESYPDSSLIPIGNLTAAVSVVHKDINPVDIANSNQTMSVVYTPSDYSLAYAANDFRNYTEKFTKVALWVPFVGKIDIPSIHLKASKIVGTYSVSVVNGQGKFTLKAIYTDSSTTPATDNEVLIMSSNISMRVEVPIAMGHTNQLQIANDTCAAISTAAQVVGAIATTAAATVSGGGAGFAMSAPGAVSNLSNAAQTGINIAADYASGFQEYTCLGSSGSLAELTDAVYKSYMTIQQMDTVTEAIHTEKGRPVMSVGTIGPDAKFIAMYAPSLRPAGATQSEIEMINSALANGIYIESEQV